MYNDSGVFQYDQEGFSISYEDFIKRINWADIKQLNAYKVDLFTTDRVDLEIVYEHEAVVVGWLFVELIDYAAAVHSTASGSLFS